MSRRLILPLSSRSLYFGFGIVISCSSLTFTLKIPEATTNLKAKLRLYIGATHQFATAWYRDSNLYGGTETFDLGVPVVQNSISGFYADTVEIARPKNFGMLESELKAALLQKNWKDANDILKEIKKVNPKYDIDILPINTNIGTNLQEDIIEINPSNMKTDVDFSLNLEGMDNPIVDYELNFLDQEAKFHDSFDDGYWDLVNVADKDFKVTHLPSDDTYVDNYYPDKNYGTNWYLDVSEYRIGDKSYIYIKEDLSPIPYLEGRSELELKRFWDGYHIVELYSTTDFDENELTWNTQKPIIDFISETSIARHNTFDLGPYPTHSPYLLLKKAEGSFHLVSFYSKDYPLPEWSPKFNHYFSKGQRGEGFIYMQTDKPETLNLVSPVYSTTNLNTGDTIYIQCKTNTRNKITLGFLSNGEIVKDFTVIPIANLNFDSHMVKIIINEEISFDQLMFSGQINEKEFFMAYDVIINPNVISAPLTFTQNLDSPVKFTLFLKNRYHLGGIYYFDMRIRLHDTNVVIYSERVPFKIEFLSDLQYIQSNEIFSMKDKVEFINFFRHPEGYWTYSLVYTPNINIGIGNIINIKYKANTSNEFVLSLLNNGQIIKEYTIFTRGNLNFKEKKNIHILVDEEVSFDQLMVSGNLNGFESFILYEIIIMNSLINTPQGQSFNPITLENKGNFPEFVEFSFSGVPSDYIDKSLYPEEFQNDNQIICLMPGEYRECLFNIAQPTEPISNLYLREIIGSYIPTSEVLISYIDSFAVDGIYINSPKNTTYNLFGIGGDYPGSYSFKNDIGGAPPEEWTIIGDGLVQVKSKKDSHRTIVELEDTSSMGDIKMINYFTNPVSSGTIEFWINFPTFENYQMILADGDDNNAIILRWTPDRKVEYDDGALHLITYYDMNEWHHYRIDFDCTMSWNLWIDGIKQAEGIDFKYKGNPSEMDRFEFRTGIEGEHYKFYVDAIGYSWEPSYNIGDNTEEGLLLNIVSQEDLIWTAYSIDGQPSIEFSGNVIIPPPDITGLHTIQVFGKNSLNDPFESEIRSFSINYPIDIKLTSKGEHYPATYGFEAYEEGSEPENWECIVYPPQSNIQVIDEIDGHYKVVKCYYGDGSKLLYFLKYFDALYKKGTVEFWIRLDKLGGSNSINNIFMISEDGPAGPIILFGDVGEGPGVYHVREIDQFEFLQSMIQNVWYRFRIDFDCEKQIFDIFMGTEDLQIGTNLPFLMPITHGKKIGFILPSLGEIPSLVPEPYSTTYIDAVGIVGVRGYQSGDNKYVKKGFTIEYDTVFDIEIQKARYSIDGLTRLPLGTTMVVPRPIQGIHTIQVFCTDKWGYKYNSEKMSFTVFESATIETPEGTNVEVEEPLTGITITYDEVTEEGTTTITYTEVVPEPPSGFNVAGEFYEIETDVIYSDMITLSFPYDESQIQGDEADLKIFYWEEDTGWIDVTTWVDTDNNIIYGEILSFSILVVLEIDTTPPVIHIEYQEGDGTDGNSGKWNVYAYDEESGINEETINIFIDDQNIGNSFGEYDVPNTLGRHTIRVEVENDNPLKPLVGIRSSSIEIVDDDSTSPEISIVYCGTGYDSDSGYFEWYISDLDNDIGGDGDSGFSKIEIVIKFDSTEGLEGYTIHLPESETGIWNLPSNIGTYTINILATDNDDDRTLILDSLSIVVNERQNILDDDLSPPELSNLIITHDIYNVYLSLNINDDSGVGEIQVLVDGELADPLEIIQNDDLYEITLANQWLSEIGFHGVEVRVTDNDNDRLNDGLTDSIWGSFETNLYESYDSVVLQLDDLKHYIDENTFFKISWILNYKLTKAQQHLKEAKSLVENGNITCGLFHDAISKVFIRISEFETELFNRLSLISDANAEYIISELRTIRDEIVILMGASVGTQQSIGIANIEIKLLTLNDYIKKNINWKYRGCLRALISVAVKKLEIAIFLISMDCEIENTLSCAQHTLELAKCKVNRLLNRGKITQELAEALLSDITLIQDDIGTIKGL